MKAPPAWFSLTSGTCGSPAASWSEADDQVQGLSDFELGLSVGSDEVSESGTFRSAALSPSDFDLSGAAARRWLPEHTASSSALDFRASPPAAAAGPPPAKRARLMFDAAPSASSWRAGITATAVAAAAAAAAAASVAAGGVVTSLPVSRDQKKAGTRKLKPRKPRHKKAGARSTQQLQAAGGGAVGAPGAVMAPPCVPKYQTKAATHKSRKKRQKAPTRKARKSGKAGNAKARKSGKAGSAPRAGRTIGGVKPTTAFLDVAAPLGPTLLQRLADKVHALEHGPLDSKLGLYYGADAWCCERCRNVFKEQAKPCKRKPHDVRSVLRKLRLQACVDVGMRAGANPKGNSVNHKSRDTPFARDHPCASGVRTMELLAEIQKANVSESAAE